MPTIFDLEIAATGINDALRANREGNAARRAEALKNVFSVLEGAQTAAQTRETIGREGRARAGFPTELGIRKEEGKQAVQKTALGGIEVRGAQRAEQEGLDINAATIEILKAKGLDPSIAQALQNVAVGEQATAEAELGKDVAVGKRAEEQTFQTLGGPGEEAAGRVSEAQARKPVAAAQVAEAGIVTETAPEKQKAVRAELEATADLAPGKVGVQKAGLAATKAGTKLTQAQVKTEDAIREVRVNLLKAQASKITDIEKFDPKLFTEQQILNSQLHAFATLVRDNPDIPFQVFQGRIFDPEKRDSLSTLKSRIQEAEIAKARMTKDEADGRAAMREMFSKLGRSDLATTVETDTPETLIAAMDALIEDAKSDIFIMTGVEFGDTKSLLADPLPKEQRQKDIDEARRLRGKR